MNNLNKSKENSATSSHEAEPKDKENTENKDKSNRKHLFRIEEKRKSALGKPYAPCTLNFQFGTAEVSDKENGLKSPPAEK